MHQEQNHLSCQHIEFWQKQNLEFMDGQVRLSPTPLSCLREVRRLLYRQMKKALSLSNLTWNRWQIVQYCTPIYRCYVQNIGDFTIYSVRDNLTSLPIYEAAEIRKRNQVRVGRRGAKLHPCCVIE